ncbi:hypothetical protein MA16_Dca005237 [Dendrobium catenatum]|uniref:Uncharacterized protein n=1 Tax=Dendrobium catenatum TaxID=906689 RepID=A0A2I0VLM3_9ASPA|nr:hypothetical protein MA16_Dca005237 [Dendrobium catenatum]
MLHVDLIYVLTEARQSFFSSPAKEIVVFIAELHWHHIVTSNQGECGKHPY